MLKNKEIIKNSESKPEVKQLFTETEIQQLIGLYDKLPVTKHNKIQKVIKSRKYCFNRLIKVHIRSFEPFWI